jgi:hypothetical protein
MKGTKHLRAIVFQNCMQLDTIHLLAIESYPQLKKHDCQTLLKKMGYSARLGH